MNKTEEFISRENVRRFRAQLEASSDEEQKGTLRQLLRNEEQRLDRFEDDGSPRRQQTQD